jgi:hypothetical protein
MSLSRHRAFFVKFVSKKSPGNTHLPQSPDSRNFVIPERKHFKVLLVSYRKGKSSERDAWSRIWCRLSCAVLRISKWMCDLNFAQIFHIMPGCDNVCVIWTGHHSVIMKMSMGPSSGHYSWIRRPARRHRWQARIRFFIKASFVGFGPSSFTKTFDSNSVLSQAIDLAFGIVFDNRHSSSDESRIRHLHVSSCCKALCASKNGRSTVFELQFELNRQLRIKVYSIVKSDFEIALMRAWLNMLWS